MPSSPRYCLKRSTSIANSSDTEPSPPRKKARRERSGFSQRPDCDFEGLLRRRVYDPADETVLSDIKSMRKLRRDEDIYYVARDTMDKIKCATQEDILTKGKRVLEVELYLQWLEGFNFVLRGIESVLHAKLPGTRRHVPGLGRLSFSILYNLIDTFMDEVNANQSGWSFRHPIGPVEPNPLIMTLAEECNARNMDARSDVAVCSAERFLDHYDGVMADALRRYKAECNSKLMATAIERKEENISRACCLLSEQTGFGGTDDIGFNLLEKTREAMIRWTQEIRQSSSP